MVKRLTLATLALVAALAPLAVGATPGTASNREHDDDDRDKVSLAASIKAALTTEGRPWPWPFKRWPVELSYNIELLPATSTGTTTAAVSAAAYRVTYCGAPWAVAKANKVARKWEKRSVTVVDATTREKLPVGTEAELMALVQRYDAKPATLEVYLSSKHVALLNPTSTAAADLRSKQRCGEVVLPYRPTPPQPIVKPAPFINDGAPYYLDTSIYTPPQSPYGHPWLLGSVQGYVAIHAGEVAIYRGSQTQWQRSSTTPARTSDVLTICQSLYPKAYAAISMNDRNYSSSWLRWLGAPSGWMTFACVTPPTSNVNGPQPDPQQLGAVLMWYGKVNKYTQAATPTAAVAWRWANDPDGVSGGNLDAVQYCQKWFPKTRSAYLAGQTMADDWRNRGLTGSFRGAGNMYVCSAQEPQPRLTAR